LGSGKEEAIEVKPQYGLTDIEVEKMLLDSITHAKDDMQIRALVEAQTEASQIIEATSQFISKNKAFLSKQELSQTEFAIEQLSVLSVKENKDEIHAAIEKLNEISRPYAERLMDEAIGKAMKGKIL